LITRQTFWNKLLFNKTFNQLKTTIFVMKKFFTLVAAMMMLSASAETLDLYEGTDWTYYAPINSMWYDTPGNQTQVLYPAADLTAMVGKKITSISFYTDENGNKMNGGVLNIFLGETDATELTGYVTDLTQVGTATMAVNEDSAAVVTLTFDTPYEYQGGNLVFGNVVAEAGNMTMTYFVGISSDYNSVVFSSSSMDFRTFLPKTTFTYEGGSVEPEFLRGDVNQDKQVNISDVTVLINLILSGDEAPASADCNLDTNVNISDVTVLINYILSGQW